MSRQSILREETSNSALECVLCLSPTADMPSIFMCILWIEFRSSLLARQLLYQMNHMPHLYLPFLFSLCGYGLFLCLFIIIVFMWCFGAVRGRATVRMWRSKDSFMGSVLCFLFIGFED